MECSISSQWISGTSTLCPPSSFGWFSHSWGCRVMCGSHLKSNKLKFVLHDALDASGADTSHARAARDGYSSQIQNMSEIERETSICTNTRIDLRKAALYIAAEDDSLISHSSVPLPVDAFLDRLDGLSTDYLPYYTSALDSSPEDLLGSIEDYLFVTKGFRRTTIGYHPSPKAFYLHSVLTQRCGSLVMLSLIYSEVLKMLQLSGVINFDVEIYYPPDHFGLPRAYNKKRDQKNDRKHTMTSESLLVEILRDLKYTYWPFQLGGTKSLFLRAADAASCIDSGFERASAKAAHHRLDRGVWTSVLFGDMKRALSACERLVILSADCADLRDYAVLLYHCGYYKETLQYLKLYKETKRTSNTVSSPAEDDALDKLMVRLSLILMEEGWRSPSRSFFPNNSEPW